MQKTLERGPTLLPSCLSGPYDLEGKRVLRGEDESR